MTCRVACRTRRGISHGEVWIKSKERSQEGRSQRKAGTAKKWQKGARPKAASRRSPSVSRRLARRGRRSPRRKASSHITKQRLRPRLNHEWEQESQASAREAGLRYFSDDRPGIHRRGHGKSALYLDVKGRRIRDRKTLTRIRALAVPPAWTDVWIAPREDAHLQATGRNAKGRKQYRYHARWREVRDAAKYERLVVFAKVLPRIRRQVRRDLKQNGLTRNKVLATIVWLLETSLIRVGNDEYAQQNHSFGLTTMTSMPKSGAQ